MVQGITLKLIQATNEIKIAQLIVLMIWIKIYI